MRVDEMWKQSGKFTEAEVPGAESVLWGMPEREVVRAHEGPAEQILPCPRGLCDPSPDTQTDTYVYVGCGFSPVVKLGNAAD